MTTTPSKTVLFTPGRRRKQNGVDINRYLGVEWPDERISLPPSSPLPSPPPERPRSSLQFVTRMFSSATSTSRQTKDTNHRKNVSATTTSTSIALPGTPLRAQGGNASHGTMTTTKSAESSFLPEFYSTPPMPTFQRPMPAATANLEVSPTNHKTTVIEQSGMEKSVQKQPMPTLKKPGGPLVRSRSPTKALRFYTKGRTEGTAPLPRGWNQQHDKAICVLDARNFTLPNIVLKMRRTFPELVGTLNPAMVDKRLQQLDQDVNIDYWRIGLQSMMNDIPEEPAEKKESKAQPLVQTQSVTNLLADENLSPKIGTPSRAYRPRKF